MRVLANVAQDEYWMSTLLHEFGHSVYSSINIPEKLPYVLRMESHILTTEGVAMMFERLSKRRAWLEKMGVKVDDPKSFDETAAKMHALPAADLLALVPGHAALREEHVRKPGPGPQQAVVGHGRAVPAFAAAAGPQRAGLRQQDSHRQPPVYYHNYMMGEMFASQLHHAIARDVFGGAHPKLWSMSATRKWAGLCASAFSSRAGRWPGTG